MFMRGCPCGIALMAWSTVAWGGNSIFGGVEVEVDVVVGVDPAADASAGVFDEPCVSVAATGFSVDGVSVAAAGCDAGVSGGGVGAAPPPHAANPKSSGNTSAP